MTLRRSARRELHRVGQPAARGRTRHRLRRPRRAARAPRHRYRRHHARGRQFQGGDSFLGCRHRRHALRRVFPGPASRATSSRSSKTAPSFTADRRHADGVAAPALGSHRRLQGAARARRGARTGLRRDELEHLPGSGGSAALVQVRQPHAYRRRGARAGHRAQHRLHQRRAGLLGSKALTVWIGDGANFPGQPHLGRAFERYLESTADHLRGAARRLAHVHRAQDV